MSDLLDDPRDKGQLAEELGLVRVVALAFLAKWIVDLFFRLQTDSLIFEGGYVVWVLVFVQLAVVQRALYAFYRCHDQVLMRYLRLFYGALGLFFLSIALVVSDTMMGALFPYFSHNVILLLIDSLLALLLIRYYLNLGESPNYWRFLERLVWLSLAIMGSYKIWITYYYQDYLMTSNLVGIGVDWMFKLLFPTLVFILWGIFYKKVHLHNRWLLLLSALAVVCWKSGLHFQYQRLEMVEIRLFLGAILAVLAFASSFNKAASDEEENGDIIE